MRVANSNHADAGIRRPLLAPGPWSLTPAVRGYSLVELLTVIALMLLLMALGAAAYIRSSQRMKEEGSAAQLEALLRQARNSAIGSSGPAFVHIEPPTDGNPMFAPTVTPWAYKMVGHWSFEGATYSTGAFKLRGSGRGVSKTEGKIGQGLSLASKDGAGGPDPNYNGFFDCDYAPEFDLEFGGMLECYVMGFAPDWSFTQVIFEKKNAYSLRVEPDPHDRTQGVLTGSVGSRTLRAVDYRMPPRRWTKVAFAWDKSSSRLYIDDALVGAGPGMETPPDSLDGASQGRQSLSFGSDAASLFGKIDEVKILAALPGHPLRMAPGTVIKNSAKPWDSIYFMQDGSLDPHFHPGPLTLDVGNGTKWRRIYISQQGATRRGDVENIAVENEAEAEAKFREEQQKQAAAALAKLTQKPKAPKKIETMPEDMTGDPEAVNPKPKPGSKPADGDDSGLPNPPPLDAVPGSGVDAPAKDAPKEGAP